MVFCFKRKESVPKALRRLAGERLDNAFGCLEHYRQTEAIHCARKDIKKVRALLKLARSKLGKKVYHRQTDLLREAANHLTAVRDADVNTKALRDLSAHFKGQLAPGALRRVRAALRSAAADETKRFAKKKKAHLVQRLLRRSARMFDNLDVSGRGWKAIGPGLKSAYAGGRQAYGAVLKSPSPKNFHDWRKRAKELWYHVRLFRPVWPEQIDAVASELETLTEYLGGEHDLVMLRQAVEDKCGEDSDARELKTLKRLLEQRQRELRKAALALGTRFYAENPSAFCARFQRYWKIWRSREKAPAQTALTSA